MFSCFWYFHTVCYSSVLREFHSFSLPSNYKYKVLVLIWTKNVILLCNAQDFLSFKAASKIIKNVKKNMKISLQNICFLPVG